MFLVPRSFSGSTNPRSGGSSRPLPCSVLVSAALFLQACQTTVVEKGTDYMLTESKEASILDSRLKQLQEESRTYPKRHDLHYQIAGIAFEKEEYHLAVAALRKAIELEPTESKYHFQLGRTYLRMKELDHAEESFREAAQLSPTDRYSGPHAALAYVLSLKKDYAGAIDEFKKCLQAEPDNLDYLYSIGAQYDMKGDKEEAIRHFHEYLLRGGTRYRKNTVFLLEKLGVKAEDLPRRETQPGAESVRAPKAGTESGDLRPGISKDALLEPFPDHASATASQSARGRGP